MARKRLLGIALAFRICGVEQVAFACPYGADPKPPYHCLPAPVVQPGPPRLVVKSSLPDLQTFRIDPGDKTPLALKATQKEGALTSAGKHRFRFSAAGFAPRELELTINARDQTTVSIELAKYPELVVLGAPARSEVWWDGARLGTVPDGAGTFRHEFLELDTSRKLHEIRVHAEHSAAWIKSLSLDCSLIKDGKPTCEPAELRVEVTLEPLPGCLQIGAPKDSPRRGEDLVGLPVSIHRELASGEQVEVRKGIIPLLACELSPGRYHVLGHTQGSAMEQRSPEASHAAQTKAPASSRGMTGVSQQDYVLGSSEVLPDQIVELRPALIPSASSPLPSAANWDTVVHGLYWDCYSPTGSGAACADLGYLNAHDEKGVALSSDAEKEPSARRELAQRLRSADHAYQRACELGSSEGCVGWAWRLRSQGRSGWQDALRTACLGADPNCLYLHTHGPIDSTAYNGYEPESTFVVPYLEIYARPSFWPADGFPVYLDVGGAAGAAFLKRRLVTYVSLGLGYRTVERLDVDSGERSRQHTMGFSAELGAMLQHATPTWAIGVRGAVRGTSYLGDVGGVYGVHGGLFYRRNRTTFGVGALYQPLPLRITTVDPFGTSVTIGSHDWRVTPTMQIGYQFL